MSAPAFEFPVLVCDTGGTNVRFALQPAPEAPLGAVVHLRTWDYAGLGQAIDAASAQIGARARSVIACGAGPVIGRTLKLTNAPWLMDGPAVARHCGLAQGLLLNDFEAQALALPAIPSAWSRLIGDRPFPGRGTQVILGPGTGLGIGALIEASGRHTPVASEACHIDFGPVGEEEEKIWPHLARVHGRVTTESVMSGPGLARLHAARMALLCRPDLKLDGAGIFAAAEADAKSEAAATLRLFWRIIARFAGDMAIAFAAQGGVTLAGGILPRLVGYLDDRAFRQAFEAKAPVDALARSIPTRLIIQPEAVLVGMAAIAGAPDRYAIDYAARNWTA